MEKILRLLIGRQIEARFFCYNSLVRVASELAFQQVRLKMLTLLFGRTGRIRRLMQHPAVAVRAVDN